MKNTRYLLLFGLILSSIYCFSNINALEFSGAKNVLVFSPHPDDDILGCGGAILTHVASGARVIIVYMTSGEAMTGNEDQELLKIRENEAKNAATKLGVNEHVFLREPDSKLHLSESNSSKVASLLREIQPDLIYVPHKKDSHEDHKETNKIVTDTIRALSLENKSWKEVSILGYEVWTPIEIVTDCLDIDVYIDQKLEALAEHKSQVMSTNYIDAIKALNRYRAIMRCGCSYAEGFERIIIS